MVMRYNLYSAAAVSGNTSPDISSGQAIGLMQEIAGEELPASMAYDWTELTYLQLQAGNVAIYVFALGVVFVFLVLAAQYESWSLPLAVILVVPMCLLFSIAGVVMAGMEVNIFTQIGFVVLVGLASKNAILIVEFAKQQQEQGKPRREATLEASRLRLRPILMTSFAFIFGVIPLVVAHGAGAEMRQGPGPGRLRRHARRDPLRDLSDARFLLCHPGRERSLGAAAPRRRKRRHDGNFLSTPRQLLAVFQCDPPLLWAGSEYRPGQGRVDCTGSRNPLHAGRFPPPAWQVTGPLHRQDPRRPCSRR